MIKQLACYLVIIIFCSSGLQARQGGDAPFATLENAVKEERAGWAGDKSRLSTVFDDERKRLGDRFESELLNWLGNDPERHYWISAFLEAESYLHGSKRLPHLSLLVKQQGLALTRGKNDERSQGYVIGFSFTAAILSDELGFHTLASAYKHEAETLLVRRPELSVYVPGASADERRRYDEIKSDVTRNVTTVVGGMNGQPPAKVSGGILNGRALKLPKPDYSASARAAGASGTVEVRIVFDETGKVIWAKAVSGHPELRQAAEDAAWQSKFSPTILAGQPVSTSGVLLYNFVFMRR